MPNEQDMMHCDFEDAKLLTESSSYEYKITSLPVYFSCDIEFHCPAGQTLKVSNHLLQTKFGFFDVLFQQKLLEIRFYFPKDGS